MRVMFIQPPMPAYGVCTPATYPSLGQILIASYLPKDTDVILIDGLVYPEDCETENIKKRINEFHPDIIGIRVMFINYFYSIRIAEVAKSANSNLIVVFGGPHATLLGKEVLEDNPCVDLVLCGEGELSFCELVTKANIKERDFSMVHNAIYRDLHIRENFLYSTQAPYVQLGDKLPRYDLLDMDYYSKINLMTIEGHRGCPNSCIFCGLPSIQGKNVRSKPIGKVMDEIRHIYCRYNITQIEFVEPNFTVNKLWAAELCHAIIDAKIMVNFVCRTYVEMVDFEILQLMHKAGFIKIFYGIESGSQKILDEYRRPAKVSDCINAVRWTRESGIKACVNFVIGAPSETDETVNETIKVAKLINADDADVSILAPFPGTAFYNDCRIKMIDKHWYKKYDYVSRFPWFVAYETTHLSANELQGLWLNVVKEINGGISHE